MRKLISTLLIAVATVSLLGQSAVNKLRFKEGGNITAPGGNIEIVSGSNGSTYQLPDLPICGSPYTIATGAGAIGGCGTGGEAAYFSGCGVSTTLTSGGIAFDDPSGRPYLLPNGCISPTLYGDSASASVAGGRRLTFAPCETVLSTNGGSLGINPTAVTINEDVDHLRLSQGVDLRFIDQAGARNLYFVAPTLAASCPTYTLPEVTGTMAVANCISSSTLPLTTSTSGELIGSSLMQNGSGNIHFDDNGNNWIYFNLAQNEYIGGNSCIFNITIPSAGIELTPNTIEIKNVDTFRLSAGTDFRFINENNINNTFIKNPTNTTTRWFDLPDAGGTTSGTASPLAVVTSSISQRLPLSTTTSGELENSGLALNGGIISAPGDAGTEMAGGFIRIEDFDSVIGNVNTDIAMRMDSDETRFENSDGINLRLFENSVFVGDDGQTNNTDLIHQSSTALVRNTIRTDDLTAGRTQDWSDNDGSIPVSTGNTGGAGSAGSGNQYIELTIGTTTYKILHDGTVP